MDLLGNPQRAKAFLSSLQANHAPLKAVVEYVHNGARMKVFIPSQNCQVNFAVEGALCGKTGKHDGSSKDELFAREAVLFTKQACLQRSVSVRVAQMDRGGTCIGDLVLANGQSLGLLLVSKGLARVNQYCRDEAMHAAEALARDGMVGLWKDYVAPQEEEEEEVKPTSLEPKQVVVVDVVDGCTLWMQDQAAGATLREVEAALTVDKVKQLPLQVYKKGSPCLCLYNDGQGPKWFRCVLLEHSPASSDSVLVRYLDFGNQERVNKSKISSSMDYSVLFKIPPLATQVQLAYVFAPGVHQDYGTDAAYGLSDLVFNTKITARVLADRSLEGILRVCLTLEDGSDVATQLVERGLLLKRPLRRGQHVREEDKGVLRGIEVAQEVAHKAHAGQWVYGDPRPDEE